MHAVFDPDSTPEQSAEGTWTAWRALSAVMGHELIPQDDEQRHVYKTAGVMLLWQGLQSLLALNTRSK